MEYIVLALQNTELILSYISSKWILNKTWYLIGAVYIAFFLLWFYAEPFWLLSATERCIELHLH